MQYFSDEQLDDMFGLLDLGQLEMMGYDNVRQVSNSDELEDLLMAIEEDFSNLDREEKIEELRSIGAFDDDALVDEVKMGAETKRQRLKREKDEAAMDEAATDVDYMREHYAEAQAKVECPHCGFPDDFHIERIVICNHCGERPEDHSEWNYQQDKRVGGGDYWAEEGNTPVMPPHQLGQPVNWKPHNDRISALKRQRAESLVEADPQWGETLVLIADRDTTITQYRFHYSVDYDGVIDGADVDVEDEMVIKKGDIVLFHFSDEYWSDSVAGPNDLVGYYDGDYYESGNPESMWGIENPEDWTLIETVVDENSPNWGGRDSEPRIVHTPGGRSWRFTISGVGKGDTEVEAFRDFVTSTKIGEAHKWDQERMSAETFEADKLPDYKDLTIEEVDIEGNRVKVASFTYGGVPMYFAFEDEYGGVNEQGLYIFYNRGLGETGEYTYDDYLVEASDNGQNDPLDWKWFEQYVDAKWVAQSMTEKQYNELGPYAKEILKQYKPTYAETFAADSPFNTLLQIRDDVIIEEEEDFHTLLQIYLSLEDDIAALYDAGMEKHGLLPEMMRYRNEIAMRLDAIQDEVAIQDTIEMDAEHQPTAVPFQLQQPLRTGYKMGLGWVGAALTVPLLILGLGAYYNQ